jgi:GMP synthase (glutamine-hydrolysing)
VKRAIVLQHADHEDAGLIAPLLHERGFSVHHRLLHAGDAVPGVDEVGDLLVVMGGPMGVSDRGDPRYAFLAEEIALLRPLVAADRPVLGICLGAQLIAHAAGADVYPNLDRFIALSALIVREVGLGPVTFLARDEPALSGMGASEIMLHWHGDTFDLPAGAVHLAATDLCPRQAFRLGRCVYGFQFHCEVARDRIAEWVREDAAFVTLARGPDGGAQILAEVDRLYDEHRRTADRLLADTLTAMGF